MTLCYGLTWSFSTSSRSEIGKKTSSARDLVFMLNKKKIISLSSHVLQIKSYQKCLTAKITKKHTPAITTFTLMSLQRRRHDTNAINEQWNQFRIVQKLDNTQWMFNFPCKCSFQMKAWRCWVLLQKTSDEHLENTMKLQYHNGCAGSRWKIQYPVSPRSKLRRIPRNS